MSSLNCFSVGQTNFRAKLLKLMLGSDPEVEIIPLAWIKDLGRESGDSSVCFDKFPCKIPDLDKMLKEKVLEKYWEFSRQGPTNIWACDERETLFCPMFREWPENEDLHPLVFPDYSNDRWRFLVSSIKATIPTYEYVFADLHEMFSLLSRYWNLYWLLAYILQC